MLPPNKLRQIISASIEDFEQKISDGFCESDYSDYLVGFAQIGYTIEQFWKLKNKDIFTFRAANFVEDELERSTLYFATPELQDAYFNEQVCSALNEIKDDEHALVHLFFNEELQSEFKKVDEYFNSQKYKEGKNGN